MIKSKILPLLVVALLMIGGLLLITCSTGNGCVGDGECYFNRSGYTKGCSNKSCIGNQPSAWFSADEQKKYCDCK